VDGDWPWIATSSRRRQTAATTGEGSTSSNNERYEEFLFLISISKIEKYKIFTFHLCSNLISRLKICFRIKIKKIVLPNRFLFQKQIENRKKKKSSKTKIKYLLCTSLNKLPTLVLINLANVAVEQYWLNKVALCNGERPYHGSK